MAGYRNFFGLPWVGSRPESLEEKGAPRGGPFQMIKNGRHGIWVGMRLIGMSHIERESYLFHLPNLSPRNKYSLHCATLYSVPIQLR
jgi:hypothetical protein